MISTDQRLSTDELHSLGRLIGATWRSMSGPTMTADNFAWEVVQISTSELLLQIRLQSSPLNIDGITADYPTLVVLTVRESLPSVHDANTYFHGQGESVREVRVLRDTVTGELNGELFFENIADIAIAIRLDSSWLVMSRASHFMEAFDVQRVTELDDAVLPDTSSEWEETLEYHYVLRREWIHLPQSGS